MAGTSNNLNLSITGDADSALRAIAEVKAAIASLRDREVTIRVNVTGATRAITDLRAVGAAADEAAAAHDRHAAAVERASGNLRTLSSDTGRVIRDMRSLGDSVNRVERDLGGLDHTSGQVSRGLSDVRRDADSASRGVQGIIREARKPHNFTPSELNRMSQGLARFTSETRRTSDGTSRIARSLGDLTDLGASSAGTFSQLASGVIRLGGSVGVAAGALQTAGVAALYATAGAGLLTAATGALGVGAAGSLGLIGAGMGAAAAGLTSFTVDSLKEISGFQESFENISRAVQGYSAWISEPYGTALVRMADQAMGSAPAIAAPLRAAFADIGAAAERNLPNMVSTAAMLSAGFQDLTTSSLPAFDAFFRHLPALTEAAIDPMNRVASTFGRVAERTFAEGVPAFRSAASALGEFGSEIVRVGADHLPQALTGIASLTRGATDMVRDLRPAIGPSMDAFVAVGHAVTGAIGEASPGIARFADTVTASAPGIQSLLASIGTAALDVGSAVVAGAANSAGAWSQAAQSISANSPAIEGIVSSVSSGVAGLVSVGAKVAPVVRGIAEEFEWAGWGAAVLGDSVGVAGSFFSNIIPAIGGSAQAVQNMHAAGDQLVRTWQSAPGGFFSSGTAASPFGDVSGVGHRPGGVPGQWSGLSTSWVRTDQGAVVPASPTGTPLTSAQVQQLQQLEDAIQQAPTLAERNRLEQAQRNVVGGVPASNVYAGMPGQAPPPGSPGVPGRPGTMAPQIPQYFGSSAPIPAPAGSELARLMQSAQTNTDAATQSAQRFGSTVSSALGQAAAASQSSGAGVQQQLQGVARSAQAAQTTIPPAINTAMSSIPQAMQQSAPPPSTLSQPMTRMVRRAVMEVAPQAESGGSNLGVSMTSGASEGVTTTETKTLTVVRQWIKKIIDIGASMLDSHSPSRVFAALGASIPQGLAVGVQSSADQAVSATQQVMTRVVQGAVQQVGGTGSQFGRNLGTQVGSDITAQFSGGIRPQLGKDLGPAFAANLGRFTASQAASQRAGLGPFGWAQDTAGTSAQMAAYGMQASQAAQTAAARRAQLARLGYSPATIARIQDREMRHNARAEARRERREMLRDAARYRAVSGATDVDSPWRVAEDAAAWRARGQQIGVSVTQGMEQGVGNNEASPLKRAAQMADRMVQSIRKRLGIASPSKVAHDIGSEVGAGMSNGLSSAVAGGSQAARGVASDRGLQVGYTWGRSVVTGADAVIKKDLFRSVSTPQIDSPQARAVLGAMGLLGPAGAGAQIWKSAKVSLGAPTTTPKLNATINLVVDGQPLRVIAQDVVNVSLEGLADAIALQRGS